MVEQQDYIVELIAENLQRLELSDDMAYKELTNEILEELKQLIEDTVFTI